MIINEFICFVERQKLISGLDKILLAVSGGIDSVVMAELFHRAGFNFGIAHCNFGLRGNESDEDEQFVRIVAEKYKVSFHCQKFPTTEFARNKGISIQMAARELRYQWFEAIRVKEKFDIIATAHHLDDQVETFFINLIRGTGISGLHGIPVRQGKVIRPLLFSYRKDIHAFALENNLTYRTDSSNATTKYLRNKIRHELIPVLNEMNPDFSRQLTSTINRIIDIEQIADQSIHDWKTKVMKNKGQNNIIDISLLRDSSPLGTLAWELFSPFGFNQSQVGNIIQCLNNENSKVFLSPTHRMVKDRMQLIIQPRPQKPGKDFFKIRKFTKQKSLKFPIPIVMKMVQATSRYKIPVSGNFASLDAEKITFPLVLRKWEPGDSFYPFGLNKKKKLSDFFIDQKFTLPDKENCWLLCSGKHITWIIGHRIDHRFRITSKTKKILSISTIEMTNDQ